MKILAIIPYVPDLIRVRPYQILVRLQERGHAVTLLTLYSNDIERQSITRLEEFGIEVHPFALAKTRSYLNCIEAIPGTTPLQAVYCWHPGLAELAAKLCAERHFAAIHVEHLRGVKYALALKKTSAELRIPLVWDSVDCIAHLFRQAVANDPSPLKRFLRSIELARTERFEAEMCRDLDCITVTSPLDQNAFESQANKYHIPMHARLHVIPNGTDLEYFSPDPGCERQPATLVVSGKMSYHANINMTLFLCREVLPIVWRDHPETRLTVVGKDPPDILRNLSADPRIQVTGTVPDIRPYLRQATAAVAPVRYGAGIQNKVLEAMGCGTPVVCSPTAVSALQAVPEQDLLVADKPEEFAHQILRILSQNELREMIGAAGRKYVEKHHRWDGIVSQFESLYSGIINQPVSKGQQVMDSQAI